MINEYIFSLASTGVFSTLALYGLSIIFDMLIISCPKSLSSIHSVDQMKKQPKYDVSFPALHFTIYSLMVFPSEKSLTDYLKAYRLIYK